MKLNGISRVRETDFGVYFWVDKDGRAVVNGEGHKLCIAGFRGDKTKVAKLRDAILVEAKGHPEEENIIAGRPVFEEGARTVSEEEYQTQVQRQAAGLEPDPLNIVNAKEVARKLGYKFK